MFAHNGQCPGIDDAVERQYGWYGFNTVAYTQTDPPGPAPDRGQSLISTKTTIASLLIFPHSYYMYSINQSIN